MTQTVKSLESKLAYTLREQLKSGIVYFSYQKKDGSIRNAIGTLHPDNYRYTPTGKGHDLKNPNGIVKYWDIEARAYRAFKTQNFIAFA